MQIEASFKYNFLKGVFLMYKLIDKELNAYTCAPEDLNYKQLKILAEIFNTDEPINNFMSFWDNSTGRLLFNEKSVTAQKKMPYYLEYLKADTCERKDIAKRLYNSAGDNENILEDVAEDIIYLNEVDRLHEVYKIENLVANNTLNIGEFDMLEHLICNKPKFEQIKTLYLYGLITGKRIERAKRKGVTC